MSAAWVVAPAPLKAPDTFAERLNAVLRFDGYVTRSACVARVVKAFGIHPCTARRWLSGAMAPTVARNCYLEGATALDVPEFWLLCGDWQWTQQVTERQALIAGKWDQWNWIRIISGMNAWEKNKLFRIVMRVKNDDEKTLRLLNRCKAGEITRRQLLEMA
jgi:hypothetical protein